MKCLLCPAEAIDRGLCLRCYGGLFQSIRQDEMTEAEAIEAEMILPVTPRLVLSEGGKRIVGLNESGTRKCLACDRAATQRGLCLHCYADLYQQVARKEITEAEAIEAGLIFPSSRLNAVNGCAMGIGDTARRNGDQRLPSRTFWHRRSGLRTEASGPLKMASKRLGNRKRSKCRTPTCGNVAQTRGVCVSCYRFYRQMIAVGKLSEAGLIREGIFKPFASKAAKLWVDAYLRDQAE